MRNEYDGAVLFKKYNFRNVLIKSIILYIVYDRLQDPWKENIENFNIPLLTKIKFTKIVASRHTLTKNAKVVKSVIFKGEIESDFREERGYNYCQFNLLVITSLIPRKTFKMRLEITIIMGSNFKMLTNFQPVSSET